MKQLTYILSLLWCGLLVSAQTLLVLPYDAITLTDEQKSQNPDRLAYPTAMKENVKNNIYFQCFMPRQEFGPFSVSPIKKVMFSPGNLQFNAVKGAHQCADGTIRAGTWRFAEHQWDYVGDATNGTVYENGVKCDNANISSTYNGWIDLFGWGTGYNPTNASTNNSDYSSFIDWGNNTISYIENESTIWRTLTRDEWLYLFFTRSNHNNLCGQSTVNGTHGYILLPDDWTTPEDISFQGNPDNWNTNQYTEKEWRKLESFGAVFLPAAGYRLEGTRVDELSDYGYYWSSSMYDENRANCIYFFKVDTRGLNYYRYFGRSVRLVQDL